MTFFLITVRTATDVAKFVWMFPSSGDAAERVASLFDEPCGITVVSEVR